MPITEILDRNCKLYGNDICLVEINPEIQETRRVTWKEYELIEPNPTTHYRREITWNVFEEKANRFANMLLSRGVKKGDKVAILLMNCLEWLPILRKWMYWFSDRNLSDVWKKSQRRFPRIVCFSM